jgi:hypothetical protein
MSSSNDKKNRLQNIAGAGILGLLGYAATRSNLIEEAIDNAGKINGLTLSAKKQQSELREVGENLKIDVNSLKEATDRLRRESIENLRERFINGLDQFLEEGEGKSIGEKRAFFAAFFDSIKEEELAGGGDTQIRELIQKGYDSLAEDLKGGNPGSGVPSLNASDRQTLIQTFNNTFSTNESLERFGKSFQKYQTSIEHFATRSRKKSFGILKGQQEAEAFGGTLDDFFNRSGSYDGSQKATIEKRFERLNKRLGNNNAAISFKAYDEGSQGVKSLYARVEFSGGKILNVPLFLGKDETGNVIYRATENLSSRYVAPLRVIKADAVMDVTSMTSTRFSSLAEARAGGGVVDFTTYIFDDMMRNLRTEDILNMSQRRINEITAYQRNFGLDAPRTMMDLSPNNRKLISGNLWNSLHASRNFQSSNALITGLEHFQRSDQKDAVKRLLNFFGDEIVGVNAAQTMTARYDDPYSQTGGTRLFGQVGLRLPGDEYLTAYDAVKTLGRKDRVLLPQTAREGQLFGRYEAIEGLKNINTFGRTNLPTVTTANTGELLGVSKSAKGTVGMNLAGFLIKERASAKLGLAEGVSYFGGKVITSTSMPKTVVESGIANTKLMELLLERQASGEGGLVVGKKMGEGIDMTIDDFFKQYGNNRGEAIIGHLDSDFASIKRRGGMGRFTLGLNEFTTESGRRRYHLIGQMDNLNLNTKLFSYLVKDTTAFADKETIGRKLASITDPAERRALENIYYNTMGGNIGNTLLSSSAQLKKSVYNTAIGMVGAMSMIDKSYTQEAFSHHMTMNDSQYLERINKIYNKNYSSLSEATYGDRTGAYLHKAVETVLDAGNLKDSSGNLIVDRKTMGHILGGVEEFHGAYGFEETGEKPLLSLFQDMGYDIDKNSSFMKAYRSNVILAAGYATTGGVHAELGRNTARVEPRFMNYLYTNLRTNFGLNSGEATGYLSSILLRQAGAESKATATLGMHISMMSLSSLPGEEFAEELKNLGNITKMSQEDLTDLRAFGQGKERALSKFLSRREKGQILDFQDIIQNQERLEKIKTRLGGRTQIFLPGAETLENFEGFKIRGAGQTVQIEGEYTRYLTDLISSINALSVEKTDELFDKSLQGFEASKKHLSTVVGTAVRQSLSGNVLGSGSYMGSGFRFGLSPEAGFEFDVELSQRNNIRSGLLEAFNRKKGYVLFQDAQSFLDGMTTYKEALKKELRVRGYNGQKLSEAQIHEYTRGLTGARLQEFFFSMKDPSVEAATSTAQRNPTLSFQHNLPGVNIMRYDFANGNQDAMFKYFSEYRGTFFNEKGAQLYRDKRHSLIRRQEAERRGLKDFNDEKYLKFLAERRDLKTSIDDIKSRLFGIPIETPEGVRKYQEVDFLNKKTGDINTITRAVRDESTIDAKITEGRKKISAVHEERVRLKEEQKALKAGSSLQEVQKRTSKQIEVDRAFNTLMQTPLVEVSYVDASDRQSRTNLRALQNKIDSALARARKGYQSATELQSVSNEIEDQLYREEERLNLKKSQLAGASTEEKVKLNGQIANAEKRVQTLKGQRRATKTTIRAKEIFERAGKPFEDAVYIDDEGKIKFEAITTERRRKGRNTTVRPSEYLGKKEFGSATSKSLQNELIEESFDFWKKGENISIKGAYNELLNEGTGSMHSSEMAELREARELNIIEKANQKYQMEDKIKWLKNSIEGTEREIKSDEDYISGKFRKKPNQKDIEEIKASIKSSKERLPARKKELAALEAKMPGLNKNLDLLIQGEESSRLSINRVIASETIFNRLERNAIGDDGNFKPGFMERAREFYGQYDPNSGRTRSEFLAAHREVAKKEFYNFVDMKVGEGKEFKNLTSAMRSLLGMKEESFQTLEKRVYDKEKGEYVTVKKSYLASEEEIEKLLAEQDELEGLQKQRNALFEDSALEDARKDNLYYETEQELTREKEALTQLEKENLENLEIKDFEQKQMRLPGESRVQISDLEDEAIRESLSEHRMEFKDLDAADQKRVMDQKKVVNRLSNLEKHLKSGPIESFEKLREVTKGKEFDSFEYEKFNPATGKVEKELTSVGEELDRMMLGLLNYHAKYGEQGGGVLHFPEINITAKLTNTEKGISHTYDGRMDLSRFMIGDFDADIYQIFHDTNQIVRKKFNQNAASFHGFYQAGGEYLFNMEILGQGMKNFSKRIGTAGMNAEQYILDQYSKEKILKDVGPIDVQVKAGMFSMIHNASEAAARSGGDMGEYMRHVRSASALISVAQEVLVIKSKKLPIASEVADSFLKSMQSAFRTGSGQELINFFEENVFKGGVFEGSGEVEVSDVRFKDLPKGVASDTLKDALETIRMGKRDFEESAHAMAKTGKRLNILSMMSDGRAGQVIRDANLTTTRQLRQLMAMSMEGGLIGSDDTFNLDVLERGLRDVQGSMSSAFNMSGRAKGLTGLALGALGASYLVGSSVSTNKLNIEEKFSDMRTRKVESVKPMMMNRDSQVNSAGISQMGQGENFNQRPINIGETYVTSSYAGRMYGEAPSYSQAQAAARQFTSAGGQAFLSVQDNRQPISNSYINKSLRD